MKCSYACGSTEHVLSRRSFLGGAAGGLGALTLGGLVQPAAASALASSQKRVLVVWLSGGLSQLESWDPKPGAVTGGPFQAIPTSVPGIHISELLPHTARLMHHLALVRGINTRENNHSKGAYFMQTGRREEPAMKYPYLGAACSRLLNPDDNPLPGHIHITPRAGGNKQDAAFLGPRHASVSLNDGKKPDNLLRPEGLTEQVDQKRQDFRARLNDRFTTRRRTAETEAYTFSYDQAVRLMEKRDLFDVTREPAKVQEKYGSHDFGRHCLLARRLLEGGATFVQVTHSNYDTHYENFEFHIEQLGEMDLSFAALLQELVERGMLESTLVVVMSEFGRTPTINRNYGRDHWGTAWSVALGGCGIKGGVVHGKTNETGTKVVDGEVHGGHLFHTYFQALGLNPKKNYYIDQRPIPMADPEAEAIKEVLA